MVIRPAKLEDAAAIADVHVRTWQAAYPGIVPAEYLAALSIEKHTDMWRTSIVEGMPRLLIATESGSLLGWVAFGPSRDKGAGSRDAEIWAIYVSADHWGAGVGKRLWMQTQDQLRSDGFRSVCLWAFPENARACRFYQSLGFDLDETSAKQFTLAGAVLNEVRYARSIDA